MRFQIAPPCCARCTHALCTVHALPADIIDANKTYSCGALAFTLAALFPKLGPSVRASDPP